MSGIGETDYSIYRLTLQDIIKQSATGLGLAALIAYTFYKSIPVFIMLIPLGGIVFPIMQKEKLKKLRLRRLGLEFGEAVWTVSGFLSAGISVENAFIKTLPELKRLYGEDAMIVNEFIRINNGIRLNKPIELMLADFASRSGIDDIKNFAEVFAIAKRKGGNMREIIENTTGIIRGKTAVNEEIKNMTASRRYEQNIMNILPFAIIIYINLTTDGFLEVMYTCFAGRAVMTICLMLIGVSYMLSNKILDIRI